MSGTKNGIAFIKNNFAVRSKVVEYNPTDSSPVGMVREVIKKANSPNGFETANILTGDFLFQFTPGDTSTDFLFDDYLAAAKISNRLDFTAGAGKFKPFIAVVNIPEISFIPTPLVQEKGNPDFNRTIRSIVTTLGVFIKYNYVGHEFAVPNYGDPVQVTFSDMELFKGPVFIGPINTGVVNTMGTSHFTSGPGSSYYDECKRKPGVVTKISTPAPAPPSVITSPTKVDKFITSLDQVDVLKGTSAFGSPDKGASTNNIPYEIAVPKNTDKSKPVTAFLMFHGDGSGGNASIKNMITKGPSYIPDGYNIVLIRPFLASTPSNNKPRTVVPSFVSDVLTKSGLNSAPATLVTFSHSGGGSAHGWFLKQHLDAGTFESTISASRFLDSDYGWASVTQLFATGGFNQSKITFLTKVDGKPDKFATGKYKSPSATARYESVYKNGARIIRANISHGGCAHQVGPEYLIPNVVETIGPPAPSGATPGAKKATAGAAHGASTASIAKVSGQILEDKTTIAALKSKQETLYKKYTDEGKNFSTDATTVDFVTNQKLNDEIKRLTKKVAADEKKLAELKKAKKATAASPPKPTTSKMRSVTPKTDRAEDSKKVDEKRDPCDFSTFEYSRGRPDDLKWVHIKKSYGGRVHQYKTGKYDWGTKKMEKFLEGLARVPGGEDFGRGYKVPTQIRKGGLVPSWAKPGWWFQHVSLKKGGDNIGHQTHESGIGVDLSIPTIYRDPDTGKVFRGMNFYAIVKGKKKKVEKSYWHGKDLKIRWDHEVDQVAYMEFLRYAMPQCLCIITNKKYLKHIYRLITKYANEGLNGWSLEHPAWLNWKRNGGRCYFTGNPGHSNHFHVRILPPGIAPGPFAGTKYAPAGGPGHDRRWDYGRLDPGYPGFIPKNASLIRIKGKTATIAEHGKYVSKAKHNQVDYIPKFKTKGPGS